MNSECIIFETRVDLPYCIVSLTALFFLILLRSTLVRSAFYKVFFTSRLYSKGCFAPKLNECLVETLFKCISTFIFMLFLKNALFDLRFDTDKV